MERKGKGIMEKWDLRMGKRMRRRKDKEDEE